MCNQETILNQLARGQKVWNHWVGTLPDPPNLCDLVLNRADLRGYDFTGCKLVNTRFGKAMVHGANFCGANLKFADLSEVEGLTEQALKRTKLAHASLPKGFEFKGREEAIKGAQKLQRTHAYILTLGLVYLSGLYQISSEIFFAPKSQLLRLTLPNGWINLGVTAFIFVTAALLTTFAIYSHLFTRRAWRVWTELPRVFPNGSSRRRQFLLEPWINVLELREWRQNKDANKLPTQAIGEKKNDHPMFFTWTVIFFTYSFPVIILFLALFVFIAFHSRIVSGFLSICFFLVTFSLIFLFSKRLPRKVKRWPVVKICIGIICLVALIVLSLSRGNPEYFQSQILTSLIVLLFCGIVFYQDGSNKLKTAVSKGKERKSSNYRTFFKATVCFLLLFSSSLIVFSYLFNIASRNIPILQANLTMAVLSESSPQFKASASFEENQYKVRGIPLVEKNLNGARLDGAFLFKAKLNRSEMKDANLSGADLRGAIIQNAHLEKAQLNDAKFDFADLLNTHLQGADFDNSSFKHTIFNDANLEGARNTETSTWELVDAVNAVMNGLTLRGASFSKNAQGVHLDNATLFNTKFANSNLLGAQFRSAKLERGTSFKGATLDQVDFTDATATGVDFRDSSLLKAKQIPKAFSECNFEDMDLLAFPFEDILFKQCIMTKTKFDLVVFTKVRFPGSRLLSAGFTGAQLRRASFYQATCNRTKFNCADLRFADFRETDLCGADLSNSDLWGADFTDVKNFDDPDNPLRVQNTLILGIIASDAFIEWALANGATLDYEAWKDNFSKGLGCDYATWPFDPNVP